MSKLYLVPNSINDNAAVFFSEDVINEIKSLRIFFVEEPKAARKLLKSLDPQMPLAECRFFDLNEHTQPMQINEYVKILKEGNAAIISEAGCPCVADPGADLVFLAHQYQIEILPLIGPSSILLALMASGLSGQNFAFNGYIGRDRQEKIQKIRSLEERSFKEQQTQILMETPYRNQSLLEDLLANCQDRTRLCIAYDIKGQSQMIQTMSIKEWKRNLPKFEKKPALFLFLNK